MSRLEELIAQLCPDGVTYKCLSEILTIKNGKDYKEFSVGPFPVYGSGGIIAYIDTFVYDKPSVLLPRKGSIEKLYYVDTPFWTVDTIFYTVINRDIVVEKYVFYALQVQHIEKLNTGGGVPSLTQSVLNKVMIPVPPLPIQGEIVRILDTFTELTAELTKRKEQYQYYINTLFQFNNDCVGWKPLGELGSFIRGRRFTKDDYVEEDGISAIHYGEIYTNYGTSANKTLSKVKCNMAGKLRYASPSDVIFTDVGETVEDVGKAVAWLGDDKVAIHDHCYAFKHKMNPKFISYYMQTDSFISEKIKYVVRTKVKTLLIDGFAKIKIPLPYPNNLEKSLNEQARIVAILDRFDALCNDLTSGLLAEIEARQKQYEYYRDKLLTFKEAV